MSKTLSRRRENESLDQGRIDQLASQINDICRSATLDLAYRVGELVIQEVFGGNLHAWATEGTRRPSYRSLSLRPDLLMSPSALCRAVAIYSLCERSGERASWRHLAASHLQEVLALPPAQQDRLLKMAEAEQWSVARLREEVTKSRPPRVRGKRRRAARILERLRALVGSVDLDALDALERDTADELSELVGDVRRQLAEIEYALRRPQSQGPSMQSERILKCPPRKP